MRPIGYRFAAGIVMSCLIGVEGVAQELRLVTLDRDTKQPVTDVRVSLLSRRRVELDTARSGPDGSFTLRAKEPGKFFLSVSRTGYPTEETDAIFLAAGETRVDTLFLAPAQKLMKVEDVVDREIVRIFGVSASSLSSRALLLPDDIERVRSSARTASDIIQQKGPSFVRVLGAGSGRVCYQIQGSNCAAQYLNGQPIPSSTDIPAEELAAVAILTPMEAQVALGQNSGAVLLFTRSLLLPRTR